MIKIDTKMILIMKLKQVQKELMTNLKLGKIILNYIEILHQVLGLINGLQDGKIKIQVVLVDTQDIEEHQMKFMQDHHLELTSSDITLMQQLNQFTSINQETKVQITHGAEMISQKEKYLDGESTLLQKITDKFLIMESEL